MSAEMGKSTKFDRHVLITAADYHVLFVKTKRGLLSGWIEYGYSQ